MLRKPPPHKANDLAWEAMARLGRPPLPEDFRLLRHLGSGEAGRVYLCELRNNTTSATTGGVVANTNHSGCVLFAMKVIDTRRCRRGRRCRGEERASAASTASGHEASVLALVDHPFLPTLYGHFKTSHYECLVMEWCAGGDLHALRLRQPLRRFGVRAARFYAAEVVVALEYLHALGVVYRDLKPENILLRADGHIMLSDFDLALLPPPPPPPPPGRGPIDVNRGGAGGIAVGDSASVVRSLSLVGTHEYVAPEVVAGRGHGAAVDWWALGVLLHELLYGTTPFRGPDHASTLANIVAAPLRLPPPRHGDSAARELIGRLLVKDPAGRLARAGDVKRQPFFKGLHWALIRCCRPPPLELPSPPLTTVFRHRSAFS